MTTSAERLQLLTAAAGRHAGRAREEFAEVAARSAELFVPFGEPLLAIDFTEHRWVGESREEAFSDWLKWILEQAEATEVLRILGVEDPELFAAGDGAPVSIVPESFALEGHEGSTGRLDLKIYLGSVVLVVELKLGDAEESDTAKNAGYYRSVKADRYIIIVRDADDEDYHRFKPRLWAEVCVELRRMGRRLLNQGSSLNAAMVLAFTAAAEQNLLKLQPMTAKGVGGMTTSLILGPVTDHLKRVVEALKHGEKEYK